MSVESTINLSGEYNFFGGNSRSSVKLKFNSDSTITFYTDADELIGCTDCSIRSVMSLFNDLLNGAYASNAVNYQKQAPSSATLSGWYKYIKQFNPNNGTPLFNEISLIIRFPIKYKTDNLIPEQLPSLTIPKIEIETALIFFGDSELCEIRSEKYELTNIPQLVIRFNHPHNIYGKIEATQFHEWVSDNIGLLELEDESHQLQKFRFIITEVNEEGQKVSESSVLYLPIYAAKEILWNFEMKKFCNDGTICLNYRK